jgi:hypothetical protein
VILDQAEWFLFTWVLGNQIGVPVPVVPALLGAGALAEIAGVIASSWIFSTRPGGAVRHGSHGR